MVKKMLLILVALLLPVIALAEGQVIDDANLFSAAEILRMEEMIARIEAQHQVDMVVLTTRNVPDDYSESLWRVRDYADDFYDNGGYGMGPDFSGMLILLDMNNRVIWLSTAGVMIDCITDAREEDILDRSYGYLSYNDYGDGIIAGLNRVEYYMNKGRQEGSFRYDSVTGQRLSGYFNTLTSAEIGIAMLAGGGIALVIWLSVVGSYSLKGKTYSYNLYENSALELTRDDEEFVRQFSHRTLRNTGNGSSGGSSGGGRSGGSGVHRSSGGRSHGGGGRRF